MKDAETVAKVTVFFIVDEGTRRDDGSLKWISVAFFSHEIGRWAMISANTSSTANLIQSLCRAHFANQRAEAASPRLHFYLIWPIRSARVKDLTVHLLNIKAICWCLLPQGMPMMCLVFAIHYRACKAPNSPIRLGIQAHKTMSTHVEHQQ